MKKSNPLSGYSVIKLLRAFSKKEFEEFIKFVSSPFFNNQSSLVKVISLPGRRRVIEEIIYFYYYAKLSSPVFWGKGFRI